MKRVIPLALFCLILSRPAFAGGMEDGMAAYAKHDYGAAMQAWAPLAEKGDPQAERLIGWLYENGFGVKQSYTSALSWYGKAASDNDAEAAALIGALYYEGTGVKQDFAAAMKWLHKSADQGYQPAQYRLGQMYLAGQGTKADVAAAYFWEMLASADNDKTPTAIHTAAAKSRDELAKKLTPKQLDDVQELLKQWVPVASPKMH